MPEAPGRALREGVGPLPSQEASVPPTLGGVRVRLEEPLARHLPLRATSQTCGTWVEVADEEELLAVIRAARAEKLGVRGLAPWADVMPPEAGVTGVVVRLGHAFERIEDAGEGLRVGASVPLAVVGLRRGYEALAGAPGVLGEALDEGWLAPMVVRTRRFKGRGPEEVEGAPDVDPKALTLGAVLRPGVKLPWVPRAGQAFSPIKRRDLRTTLTGLGLAGLRLGGAMLAEDDPRVLANRGEASPRQLRLLVQAVQERLKVATGLELEERLVAPGRGGKL